MHRMNDFKRQSDPCQCEEFREAVRDMRELLPLPGEEPNETFERIAEKFKLDTGYMHPGKSQAVAVGAEPSYKERCESVYKWRNDILARVDALLGEKDGG